MSRPAKKKAIRFIPNQLLSKCLATVIIGAG